MLNTSNKKVYFITGGGTGGHIYPAMAVADALAKDENVKIYYIGNPDNLEYGIAQQKGYEFLPVNVKGMPRKISLGFILWGIKLAVSIVKSLFYLSKYQPQGIFGTGGYVSAPIMIAAILEGKIPFMMHDCDAQPGLVTRKLSPHASAVSLAFDKAKDFINNKNSIVSGNPLRPEFKTLSKSSAKTKMGLDINKITLLVMGGSQGAKSIDKAFVEIIRELAQNDKLQIVFQTGKKNLNDIISRLEKIYPEFSKNKNIIIKPYFDDMVTTLKASDIVISRAGSLSLSEIFASDTASVLIPYPFAAANHQRKNAKFVEEKGACIYLEDEDTNPNSLNEIINELLNNEDKRNKIRENSSKLAQFDALNKIVETFIKITD